MGNLKGRVTSENSDSMDLKLVKRELESRLKSWVDHVDSTSDWKYAALLRVDERGLYSMDITLRSKCDLWESDGSGATAHEALDRAMEHFVRAQTGDIEMDTTDRSHQSRAA
jgi:hypothetical protein